MKPSMDEVGDLRRQRILDFIEFHQRLRGMPPTYREIGAAVGLSSTSTVVGHIRELERRGLVTRSHYRSRSIRLTKPALCPHCGKELAA